MFALSGLENIEFVLINFLRSYSVKANEKEVINELQMHPEYGSFLSISDVLNSFQIRNYALNIKAQELENLQFPFIAQTSENNGEFVIVHDIVGVIPKVAASFFAKWPHLSLQSVHSISPESVHSADFKAF